MWGGRDKEWGRGMMWEGEMCGEGGSDEEGEMREG